ncbi:uncharacterized protein [Triticum aestivum]|uniref:uncharacterized protein isoform X2 n=1 Tax=Triticum aestivum TaxID=4565 RepID=UPI001D02AB72|nr:uncharacterized protein LOC123161839 isoform X2 [Triticum aestivum]
MLLPWMGFLVRGLPSGWSKEGASSTPQSWLSLSANWISRASSGTSLACAMILASIRQKFLYKELQEKTPKENLHPTMCFSSLDLDMLIFSCILYFNN